VLERCQSRNKSTPKKWSKFDPRIGHEGPEGEVKFYSFFNFGERSGLTANASPGNFTPGKESRFLLCKRKSGPKAGLDGCGKFLLGRDLTPGPWSPIDFQNLILLQLVTIVPKWCGNCRNTSADISKQMNLFHSLNYCVWYSIILV